MISRGGGNCWNPTRALVTQQILILSVRSPGAYGMRTELHHVDYRVAKTENTLQQLANVIVLTARQDERLTAIERRVDRLEKMLASKSP